MDFGMPTLIDLKSLEACAVLCKELDLQFVELNMDLPEYQVDMLDLTQLADITKWFGIYYTIHLEDT
ncbi:MAG: sugar phosphate isomerase/epimerase, partial [Eubacteriales bacterium]|nr:sugar phosphate isomerase/epimerase [Eubacteriales bacterium]